MLRVDAYYFANGGKNLRFQKYPDTCGRSLEGLKKNLKCVSVKRAVWVYLFLTNAVSGLRLRSGLGLTLTLSLT